MSISKASSKDSLPILLRTPTDSLYLNGSTHWIKFTYVLACTIYTLEQIQRQICLS
uniref:Uncharacterized protein n=1 Tax=Arundo donax TaxID=35708 RepID=A0A0A9GIQ6_ARUDO